MTHGRTLSKRQFGALVEDIRVKGIKTPIEYVEHNGHNYIVNGHHRYLAARQLGMSEVPAVQRTLPIDGTGYRTPADLVYDGYYG